MKALFISSLVVLLTILQQNVVTSKTVLDPDVANTAENQGKKCVIKTPDGDIPCYPMNTQG
ncbi:hypothetical protein Cri9333_0595 [Crinalium epipsammum PCC 9333]|uniref:Uncharacterized protein n=1 Tax=Crinalium epipsammum PCC 9333 TaxID=1173022 RepID=K9VUD3_9CYAN|nr:hypothetical protein [Crinalium epipsammum]AFZ11541.1 hypothetical protein Cri9333_0595 [Crinalium epipsammum PCC 9333]